MIFKHFKYFIRTEGGFTLTELLIGMNISFLAITLVFLLFIGGERVINLSIDKIDEQQKVYQSFVDVINALNRTEQFTMSIEGTSMLITDKEDNNLISLTDRLEIKGMTRLDSIKLSYITLTLSDGEVLKVTPEEPTILQIHSNDIKEIQYSFHYGMQSYEGVYLIPDIAMRRFIDI